MSTTWREISLCFALPCLKRSCHNSFANVTCFSTQSGVFRTCTKSNHECCFAIKPNSQRQLRRKWKSYYLPFLVDSISTFASVSDLGISFIFVLVLVSFNGVTHFVPLSDTASMAMQLFHNFDLLFKAFFLFPAKRN